MPSKFQRIFFALSLSAVASISAFSQSPISVSLVQLIANPERYDRKVVQVEGYLHYQFEDHGLYLSKDDADHLIGWNAVWVSPQEVESNKHPSKNNLNDSLNFFSCDCQYVLIEGTFDMHSHGHMGSFSGEIKNSNRVMKLTRWYDGKVKLRQ